MRELRPKLGVGSKLQPLVVDPHAQPVTVPDAALKCVVVFYPAEVETPEPLGEHPDVAEEGPNRLFFLLLHPDVGEVVLILLHLEDL